MPPPHVDATADVHPVVVPQVAMMFECVLVVLVCVVLVLGRVRSLG